MLTTNQCFSNLRGGGEYCMLGRITTETILSTTLIPEKKFHVKLVIGIQFYFNPTIKYIL